MSKMISDDEPTNSPQRSWTDRWVDIEPAQVPLAERWVDIAPVVPPISRSSPDPELRVIMFVLVFIVLTLTLTIIQVRFRVLRGANEGDHAAA
jgi:hypothetical protein